LVELVEFVALVLIFVEHIEIEWVDLIALASNGLVVVFVVLI